MCLIKYTHTYTLTLQPLHVRSCHIPGGWFVLARCWQTSSILYQLLNDTPVATPKAAHTHTHTILIHMDEKKDIRLSQTTRSTIFSTLTCYLTLFLLLLLFLLLDFQHYCNFCCLCLGHDCKILRRSKSTIEN